MIRKKLPLKYSFTSKGSYLSINVSGDYSVSDSQKMFTESLEKLMETNLSKVFFNVCKVKGKITTMNRYELAEYAAIEAINFTLKGLSKLAIAFYGVEPIIDPERFGELVARNRGLNIKVLTNKQEALQFFDSE